MKNVQDNLALVVSLLVGLAMLWTKFVEVWGQRKAKSEVDVTALTTKHIDDETAWRKDILAENQNLRMELREANKLIADNNTKCAEKIAVVLQNMENIVDSIERTAKGTDNE